MNQTKKSMWNPFLLFILIVLTTTTSCLRVPEYILSENIPPVDKKREAKMLSAFFGLDNGLTLKSRLIWKKAPGKDGMPIVFSHEIDPKTVGSVGFSNQDPERGSIGGRTCLLQTGSRSI